MKLKLETPVLADRVSTDCACHIKRTVLSKKASTTNTKLAGIEENARPSPYGPLGEMGPQLTFRSAIRRRGFTCMNDDRSTPTSCAFWSTSESKN